MKGEKIRSKNISSSEWILLETLDCRTNRPMHTGPFLTVQRRRRRRKYVRTYLFKDPTLIDDLSVHQTNFVLARINNWAFNAFILDNVTGGRPLPTLCVHLFKAYGLLQHFNLDPVIVWKLFSIIEDGYHWRNPYHNGVHAADVTQAMHCFLQEDMILNKVTPLEIFSAILAAVTHDLDHPGVNQPFLIATSNHLAALYKNSSVLENHHWRSAMGCLNESGVSLVLGAEMVSQVEEQIRSLVLATDITRQQEFLNRLKNYLDTNTLNMDDPDVRHFVLQIALKCADISNPCRPWDISRKWSMKVCEEFFRQGDYERQLNLPVTSICDRYSSSVPKIQTGFYQFVVRPLFTEWHRMLTTTLSTGMMKNLDSNKQKWDQLLQDELAQDTQTEVSDAEDSEAQAVEDGESHPSLSVTVMGDRGLKEDLGGARSVRFDPHTTITAASDSDNSDGDEGGSGKRDDESGFLGIPGPYARRHSIATGLMGSNIQVPPGGLLNASGMSSHGGSTISITEMVTTSRTVGRTVIRRESLPGTVGRTLPTKTILHLQRLSAKQQASESSSGSGSCSTAGATAGSTSPGDFGDTTPAPASPNRVGTGTEKSSCSSCSTTDEILDFTYSLPETGSRSSGSPRRLHHETTDLDELCPGTSILSMSPSVAHVTLQQTAELEDQRRHLIRQQTCPVVSITDGSGNFNRPRFLSAAAAVSPTAVASSSILTQHRSRNRSPEVGVDDLGRCSGGSSSEALMCEVISEEADRQSGGSSSAEASPLEIFVQQFPPVSDDNDGEAPRRESLEPDKSECDIYMNKTESYGSIDLLNYSSSEANLGTYKSSFDSENNIGDSFDEHHHPPRNSQPDKNVGESGESTGLECCDGQERIRTSGLTTSGTHVTLDSATQTDPHSSVDKDSKKRSSCPQIGYQAEDLLSTTQPITSNNSNSNRLATILMWRNNRLWKSLTEEEVDDPSVDFNVEENLLSSYYHGWNVQLSQQAQQGVLGARLQLRRGSAPTAGPSMGCRGAQDRRSDPTQYHSKSCVIPNNSLLGPGGSGAAFSEFPGSKAKGLSATRRGSAPVDLRQNLLRTCSQNPKPCMPRMGRRGSLPAVSSSSESSFAYKWMHVFPFNEDDGFSLKRRSSGGPELFAAAQQKVSSSSVSSVGAWKAQIFIEKINTSETTSSGFGYWPGRRRGSLPIDVCIASSGSCSSESESSAGDASDT
ncbi:unnamed protein product [Allacma fusca]|uniref:Phosphodiesterase n=1 Tax=Allacma fusca TaxID=39272 RepID=A0A8J2LAZ7_9HEXA|nr:unnamed protein product [Allacma fusca]